MCVCVLKLNAPSAQKAGTRACARADEDGDDWKRGKQWRPASAALLWMHHALAAMDADLRDRYGVGARIIYARGPYAPALRSFCRELGCSAVVANRRYEPATSAADERIEAELQAAGITVRASRPRTVALRCTTCMGAARSS